jgi:hypothetical protein
MKLDKILDVQAVEVAGMESDRHRSLSRFERKVAEASK